MPEENERMEVEDRRLEIRSEVVQEILTRVPGRIIRSGISLVFIILMLLITSTWFIKYPDLLTSRITLSNQNPPARMIAHTGGKIEHLFVQDDQKVKKGDYLVSLQSIARMEDVLKLKAQLAGFGKIIEKPQLYASARLDTSLSLGEFQGDHSAFLKNYFEIIDFYASDYYNQKITAIQEQVNDFSDLNDKLTDQKKILTDDFTVNEKLFEKDKMLYASQVESESDYLIKESSYLQKKYSFENITVTIINNTIQAQEHKKSILDLQYQEKETKRNLMAAMRDSYSRLLSQIASWERNYVLIAPIDGQVSFFKYWSENQYVNNSDEIMSVVADSNKLTGKVILPALRSGKVKVGQEVKIKFDGYPYNEFGIIEGKITSISKIPSNNQYAVNVELVNGLTTTYHKQLDYRQEMEGTAEIVTEDLRLMQRIFNQFRTIFHDASK